MSDSSSSIGGGGGGAISEGPSSNSDTTSSSSGPSSGFGAIDALHAAIRSIATTTAATADAVEKHMQRIANATQQGVDKLDVLGGYLDKMSGPWADELKLQINLLQTGGERIDDFLNKWGQAVVQTEQGGQTIRQILQGIDFNGAVQQVRQLALEIHNGTKTVADGLALLKDKGGVLTDEFVKMVEAFKAGKATIQQLEAALANLKKIVGPDSGAGDLAQQIVDGVRQGTNG